MNDVESLLRGASDDPLRLHVDVGGARYELRELVGAEAISDTPSWRIAFSIDARAGLDPEAVVGGEVDVVFARKAAVRTVTRTVIECTRRATHLAGTTGAEVVMTLVPRLDTLRHRVDIRIFREKTVPQIVEAVIGAQGIPVDVRLTRSYPVLHDTVQWRESDLAFVSRLLESEGIFYFVTDGDGVVLADALSSLDAAPRMPFREGSGLDDGDDAVFELGEVARMMPGRFTFRDFDFERPSLDLGALAAGPTPIGPEVYTYPGGYTDPGRGAAVASNAADAARAAGAGLEARTYAGWIRPGLALPVDGDPLGLADPVTVTRVEQRFDRLGAGFAARFEALAPGVVPRPERKTPRPTLAGPMIGYVVGPPGADIHTDAWGRVKIHFPWDRLQPKDGEASWWIPTLQDNTGHSVSIPRTGWEMVAHFPEGDPDHPILLGRVYNPLDDFFAELPTNKMYTALRSLTSPRNHGGETGENQILFDDRAGFERINMLAEKDRRVLVANDKDEETKDGDTRRVHRDETIEVGNSRHLEVKTSRSQQVLGTRKETIGASRTLQVDESMSETTVRDHTLTIGGSHVRRIENTDTTTTEKTLSERIGALALEASVKDNTVRGGLVSAWTVGGMALEVARDGIARTAGRLQVDTVGFLVQKAKAAIQQRVGKARTVTIGGSFEAKAGLDVTWTGTEGLEIRAKSAALTAKERLTLVVGDSKLTIAGETIELDTPETIEVAASAKNHLAAAATKQNE